MSATAGWVAVDLDGQAVWGVGATEEEAHREAWKWLAMEKPKYGVTLGYFQATEALVEWVGKHGGENVPLRIAGGTAALTTERFEPERCPFTADLFRSVAGLA